MAFIPQVNSKDAVFVQRDDNNSKYEQINISASDAIVYLDENGHIMADKISAWAAKYSLGSGGISDSASWASSSLTSSFIAFNGDRPIKREDSEWEGINVGGTNVVDFLENFFFPFISATISINSTTTYYETGSAQNVALSGTITANDETIFSSTGSIKRTGIEIATFPSASTYSLSNGITGSNGISGYTYMSQIYTNNDDSPTLISSPNKAVNFVFPYLYGMSKTSGLTGVNLYNALTGSVTVRKTNTFSIIGTATYIYYAYPVSYGPLSSIKDPSGYEIKSAFSIATKSVVSSGLNTDWMQNYAVYQTLLWSSPSGNYTFTI